jgi:ubiquinone/menaquinone biosynthesis C-methylase UbiE
MPRNQDVWDAEYRRKGVLWRGETELPKGLQGRVLELGCGDGKSMAAAKELDVIGVDISREGLRLCAARLGGCGPLLQADATCLPFTDGAFDAVLAFHILENLNDAEVRALALEVAHVLHPDGILWVRCFHPDDMRSPTQGGKEERSGISYRYRDEGALRALLRPLQPITLERRELRKRYHGRDLRRVVLHGQFKIPLE